MKSHFVYFLLLPVFACNSAQINYMPLQTGKCDADTSHHYHYSMPAGKTEDLPLVIVLDPHGNGKASTERFISAAGESPCVIVGSDQIRNNMQGFEKAISVLIEDVSHKFHVNKSKVILAGFSGGARMAFEFARNNKAAGLLMCGAGPSNLWNFSCPVWLIAGTTDFNFREVWINPLQTAINKEFYTDYFRGKHDWPPRDQIKTGLLYLLSKTGSVQKMVIQKESNALAAKADSLQKAGDFFLALKDAEKAILFNNKNKKALKIEESIKKTGACKKQISDIENNMLLEIKISNEYMKAMAEKDSTWWFHELDYLFKQIDRSTGNSKDHFMRVKSFVGILFYSQINQYLRERPVNQHVTNLMAAYRKAEPENPDVYYDFALYAFLQNNSLKAHEYLGKARSLGFTDQARINADFPPGY